jgi:signal transduction histidine kinase
LLDENISIVLFRLVQEAVSNAIKYSKADNFIVNLTVLSDEIVLYIMDDGIGFNTDTQKQGFGLSGMANRVKTLGATFQIESYNGTKITVRIPI